MILYSLGNAPTKDFLNFCNLIYLKDQGTFSVIRDFLPLIPERTLRTINYPEKVYFKNCLLEVENIPKILAYYYPDASPENQVHLTLGGDAASIKTIIESGLPSMYNFMALPLEKNRKPVSLHICPTRNGTSSKEIVEKSEMIIQIIEKEDKFVVDFVATDGDIAFDYRHKNFFKSIEPILDSKLIFIEKINRILNFKHIPVNDPLHLYKNGRSHLLNHIMLVDPSNLKVVVMELFQKVTDIQNAINDKTSMAAMKDSYAFELFSWDCLYKLIINGRFDAAYYILPFSYMIQATNSPNLNGNERFDLLENAINCFLSQLKNVRKSSSTDFFTPAFSDNSIGTLFGEEIYIMRCINTCVALAIAMLKMDDVAFSRIGTHDVEIFFGKIRLLSHFNYTFENALKSTINTIILNRLCVELNYQIKIRQRINESGAFVPKEILLSENHANFNFGFIADTLLDLLRGKNILKKAVSDFQEYVDTYTSFSREKQNEIQYNHQTVYSGTFPLNRLTTSNYATKTLPKAADEFSKSPLNFYIKQKTSNKTSDKKFSMIQWFTHLLKTIATGSTIKGSRNHFELLQFDPIIKLECKKKIIEWLRGMTLVVHSSSATSENTNQMESNDRESDDDPLANHIRNINNLLNEFIEYRSKRFNKDIERYSEENLFNDLYTIQKIVHYNFLNDETNIISEMEQTRTSNNSNDDDIKENIYDFNTAIMENSDDDD